jgi:hypothetical protein
MLKGKSNSLRAKMISSLLKYFQIKNKVVLWSIIGNALLEIYVPTATTAVVLDRIEEKGATTHLNPDIWKAPPFMDPMTFMESTITRLEWQSKKSSFINLTKCIRQGIEEHIKMKENFTAPNPTDNHKDMDTDGPTTDGETKTTTKENATLSLPTTPVKFHQEELALSDLIPDIATTTPTTLLAKFSPNQTSNTNASTGEEMEVDLIAPPTGNSTINRNLTAGIEHSTLEEEESDLITDSSNESSYTLPGPMEGQDRYLSARVSGVMGKLPSRPLTALEAGNSYPLLVREQGYNGTEMESTTTSTGWASALPEAGVTAQDCTDIAGRADKAPTQC